MYCDSGTMSNLIALGAHCRRGDEIIVGDKAHIFMYEGAGASGACLRLSFLLLLWIGKCPFYMS